MSTAQTTQQAAAEQDDFQLVRLPRRIYVEAELDITPMIDITFLLIIFFLVCSTASIQGAAELPPARHGTAVSPFSSVIITIADENGKAKVYLGDGKTGTPLPDNPETQEGEIIRAVSEGLNQGKTTVLIKAERNVKEGEVARVAMAASQVEGVQLHVAVMEVQ